MINNNLESRNKMKKYIYLIVGILTSIVFVSMLIDTITENSSDFSQIKFKAILKLMGWLLLTSVIWYGYYKKK